jgi:uncharacterized protein with LGFP repeats
MTAIDDRYNALGGAAGFLGAAVSDEEQLSMGGPPVHVRIYEHGAIYWIVSDPRPGGPPTGFGSQTFEVHGVIWEHYQALGREGSYGLPTSDETACRDGVGRFNTFANGGAIYWTGPTGAHEVHGTIHEKWRQLGAEQSFLGYPTTDETGAPDGQAASTTSKAALSIGLGRRAPTRFTARFMRNGASLAGSAVSSAIRPPMKSPIHSGLVGSIISRED